MSLLTVGIAVQLIDKITSPLKSVTQSTDNLSRSLKSATTATEQFSRGFALMTKVVEKAKVPFQQIREQAEKIKDIGKNMALKGTATFALGVVPAYSAATFEKAMAEVATLTDMSVKEFKDKYGKQVLELSVELGQPPETVVKGLYQAISAGIDPKDAIEFMRKAGQAAIAGVSDIFTSTDLATSIKNAFNVPISEMGKVYDIIFQTVRKGKTTYNEIAMNFSQVGAAASSAGISLEHVQSAVAQMTLGGVRTERAYTSLKYVIDALVAPSDQAKKAFQKLGIEINAEVVRQKDLLGTMDLLMNAMKNLSEKERAEIIAEIFGSQEAQLFVKDFMVNMDKYRDMLKEISNSTGAADEAYKKMADTTAHHFETMKQSLAAIKISVGATILPVLSKMLHAISVILTPLANFAQRHKLLTGILLGGVLAISGVVAALGVMGIAIGMAIKGYTNLRIAAMLFTAHKWRMITAVKAMTAPLWANIKAMAMWVATMAKASFAGILSGLRAVTVAMKTFTITAITCLRAVAVAMFTTPVGWILLGITALVGAGYLLWRNWDRVSKALTGVWDWLKRSWKSVLQVFLWLNPITAPMMALNKLVKYVTGISLFDAGKKIIESLYKGIVSVVNKPVEAMKGLVTRMRNLLPFSPAKEGPFRDLHRVRIIETIAETIKPAPLLTAMATTMKAVKAVILPEGLKSGVISSSASRGYSSVIVNYSPTITLSGATPQAKEDFAKLLKQHQTELLRLIQDAQAKSMRLAY